MKFCEYRPRFFYLMFLDQKKRVEKHGNEQKKVSDAKKKESGKQNNFIKNFQKWENFFWIYEFIKKLPFQSFSRHHEEDIIANSYCKNDFRFRLKNISC